jgi:hypothetical protein
MPDRTMNVRRSTGPTPGRTMNVPFPTCAVGARRFTLTAS